MQHRFTTFLDFVGCFIRYASHIREVFIGLVLLMLGGSLLIAYFENLPFGESIYFTFITGLSIGYGDIEPTTAMGRLVSVGIGFVGMIFVGMNVAVATRALADLTSEKAYSKKTVR